MSKSGNDHIVICGSSHGCYIVDLLRDHTSSQLTFAEDMKIEDKYVVWDGISEEKPVLEHIMNQCSIMSNGELLSISEMLEVVKKKPLIVPTIVFSCKNGQKAAEKGFNGIPRGVFSYFCNDLLERDPKVTFRDAISLINIAMQQEGLEQRAEVFCRTDILDMPMMEAPLTIFLDMCRTEQTLADFKRGLKGPESV